MKRDEGGGRSEGRGKRDEQWKRDGQRKKEELSVHQIEVWVYF